MDDAEFAMERGRAARNDRGNEKCTGNSGEIF